MRLTDRTDYALRVLMILAASDERCAVAEMADWLNVSANHLSKVVQDLQANRWVVTSRGRGGGVELAIDPKTLCVGEVIRHMEFDLFLAECFRPDGDCPLDQSCGLINVLRKARQAFLDQLDQVTLASLIRGHKRGLVNIAVHRAS